MSVIDISLGAVELGGMIMMLFYGIMVAQAYTYFKSSLSGDSRLIHVLVGVSITLRIHFTFDNHMSPLLGASSHVGWDPSRIIYHDRDMGVLTAESVKHSTRPSWWHSSTSLRLQTTEKP